MPERPASSLETRLLLGEHSVWHAPADKTIPSFLPHVEFHALYVEFTALYVEFTALYVEFTAQYVEFQALYVQLTALPIEFCVLCQQINKSR